MENNSEQLYRSILNALNDEQSMRIIQCTSKNAKSMNEIIQETNIARTTIHRKISSLVNNGILYVENFTISKEGKKSMLFRCRISDIKIKHENGNIFIMIGENSRGMSKLLAYSKAQENERQRNMAGNQEDLSKETETIATNYL